MEAVHLCTRQKHTCIGDAWCQGIDILHKPSQHASNVGSCAFLWNFDDNNLFFLWKKSRLGMGIANNTRWTQSNWMAYHAYAIVDMNIAIGHPLSEAYLMGCRIFVALHFFTTCIAISGPNSNFLRICPSIWRASLKRLTVFFVLFLHQNPKVYAICVYFYKRKNYIYSNPPWKPAFQHVGRKPSNAC